MSIHDDAEAFLQVEGTQSEAILLNTVSTVKSEYDLVESLAVLVPIDIGALHDLKVVSDKFTFDLELTIATGHYLST